MRSLYKHQQEILDASPNKALLALDTGLGKSFLSLELAKVKNKAPVLIICPKALTQNWEREITEAEIGMPYTVITKETFRRDWDKLPNYPTIIADECHYFASLTSQMSKTLTKYFKKWNTPYRYLLTATPYMSTPWNIFVLANHLDLGLSYWSFRREYFVDVNMGGRMVPLVKKGKEEDIKAIIKKVGFLYAMEDCFDVPEQVFELETFELTPPQKRGIKNITEPEHIVYWTKRHQIENGCLKGDEYTETEYFKSNKTERIRDICLEHKKVAIVCRYNAQIDMLKETLEKDKHHVLLIRGDVKDRDAVVQEVNKLDEVIVLIQASCSEGYELQTVGTIVFASLDFSYKNYKQMKGRFLRANALKKNLFIHMVVDDGVDKDVYNNIMNKQDFSLSLYSK
jgi:superfamily II DNA or RNA helicase